MSNKDKDKAKQIAKEKSQNYGFIQDCDSYRECYESAMQMAEWKDNQFSKFLLWLDDFYVIRKFDDGEPMTYTELIDNFKSNYYEHNITRKD